MGNIPLKHDIVSQAPLVAWLVAIVSIAALAEPVVIDNFAFREGAPGVNMDGQVVCVLARCACDTGQFPKITSGWRGCS